MAKVSIIIPIYNAEIYLKECLESVVNQTLKDIEIICVNDGSTDNSLDIINEYAKYDNRIIVIDKKNAGMGAAYNSGLEIANGEYIGFVEPDDYISLNMYEELYNCTQTKPDIVRSDWFLLKGKQITEQNKYSIYNEGIYNPRQLDGFLYGNLGHWSCIYKNQDFINKYNIRFNTTPGAAFQDVGFVIITHLLTNSIYIKPNKYYYYRIHQNQSINLTKYRQVCRNWANEFEFVEKYLENNQLAKKTVDLALFNSYAYRLLERRLSHYWYIKKVSKILNSDLLKLGYRSENFTQRTDNLYNLVLKKPLLAYINICLLSFRTLINCYF